MSKDVTIGPKNQRQSGGDVLSISGSLLVESGGAFCLPAQTCSAAGTNASSAGALIVGINQVVSADGTKGVVLPSPNNTNGGDIVVINNAVAKNLPVYPNAAGGSSINGSTSAATVGSSNGTIACCYDGTNWFFTPKTAS